MMKKHFAAALITCALIKTGFAPPAAADIPSDAIEPDTRPSSLPYCINSSTDLAQIKDTQKANAKTSSKYDGYRKILQASTDLELATRLAYAESLAANCAGEEDRVMDMVTAVIGNRVRVRHGDVRSVVLQRDQFASSLNIYPESRYRDFICPTDSEFWNKTLARMRTNLESSKPSASLPGDAFHYYLYRHSDRFEAPDWKLEEVTTGDEKLRECIRAFRNPSWK